MNDMPTVGEILQLHEEIEALFDVEDGVLTPEIDDKLARLAGDLETKIHRLHRAHEYYLKRSETLKERAATCRALAKQEERKAASCEGAVRLLLERFGKTSYDLPDGKVALGQHRVEQTRACSYDDPSMAEYVSEKPQNPRRDWSLTAIGSAIKEGRDVPGFRRVRGVRFR